MKLMSLEHQPVGLLSSHIQQENKPRAPENQNLCLPENKKRRLREFKLGGLSGSEAVTEWCQRVGCVYTLPLYLCWEIYYQRHL